MPGGWRLALQRAWLHRGFIACLLWPVSLLYGAMVALRRLLYRLGMHKPQRADAVVVVVGNVIAGGAGKTPTTIALVRHLQERQYAVGVVSRGYGRDTQDCREVLDDSPPQSVGDEPLLIRRTTGVPVFVAPTRHAAACALKAAYPQTQIIVCDDGLQHYGLYRDLEVCVFDSRGVGNGWLLPAGPLRETWPRRALASAGQDNAQLLVLHTASPPAFDGLRAQRRLSHHARGADGAYIPLASLHAPGAKPLAAVAGIAQPEAFFAMLRALHIPLARTLALPDHFHFDSTTLAGLAGMRILCTEKDAAKLWPLAPDALAVPLQLVPEAAFFAAVDAALAQRLRAKLSSPHGHPIT